MRKKGSCAQPSATNIETSNCIEGRKICKDAIQQPFSPPPVVTPGTVSSACQYNTPRLSTDSSRGT